MKRRQDFSSLNPRWPKHQQSKSVCNKKIYIYKYHYKRLTNKQIGVGKFKNRLFVHSIRYNPVQCIHIVYCILISCLQNKNYRI